MKKLLICHLVSILFAFNLLAGPSRAEEITVFEQREMLFKQTVADVENSSEYKAMEIECSICSDFKSKEKYEEKLREDDAYAKKYGVVNYGRKDAWVQRIKSADRGIKKAREEYKKLTGKSFQQAKCKKYSGEGGCGDVFEDFLQQKADELLRKNPVWIELEKK